MQRYYQGQLDFFCAIYAVINALTALYGINLAQSRALFATILADIAPHKDLWLATLTNKTDFHWLAEHMLLACSRGGSFPVRVYRPFTQERELSENADNLDNARMYTEYRQTRPQDSSVFWKGITDFLPETAIQPRAGTARKVAVLRFHRYIRYVDNPIVSHWSMADHHTVNTIFLRDASKEESALHSLDQKATVFLPELVSESRNVRVEPNSVYFIERR